MDDGSRSEPDRPTFGGLVAGGRVVVLAWWIGVYLGTLELQGWIFTELATLKAGRLSFAGMLADRATYGHCPLYFTLAWTIQRIFGEHPVALRLPSAICGLIVAVLVIRLTRAWASEAAAIFAGLTVLASPFLLEISQQARPYALALVFTLAATAVLTDPIGHSHPRRAVVFGLFTLAGLLTSHAYWFVVAAHAAALLLEGRRNLRLLLAALAAIAAASPWTIYAKLFASSGGESERFLTWMSPVDAAVSLALPGRLAAHLPFEQGESMALPIVVSVLAVVVGGVGLARLPSAASNRAGIGLRPLLAALWIVPPAFALAAGLAGWGNLLLVPRYFAATAVVQLVLVAWAAWSVGPGLRRLAPGLLVVLLAGGSAAYLVEISRDEVRRSARITAAGSSPQEAIIFIGTLSDLRLFKHYLDRPVVGCVLSTGDHTDEPVSDRHFPRYRGRRTGAWVVVDRDGGEPFARSSSGTFEIGRLLETLGRRYGSVTSRRIGGLELLHLSDRDRRGGGDSGAGDDAGSPGPGES
jgi:hypothetical protein